MVSHLKDDNLKLMITLRMGSSTNLFFAAEIATDYFRNVKTTAMIPMRNCEKGRTYIMEGGGARRENVNSRT